MTRHTGITEEQVEAWQAKIQAQKRMGKVGGSLVRQPLHGANDGPVPNEAGNTVRNPRMARNKATAPVSLRGKSVEALDCAGRGEAYSPEAGRVTKLRTKESERSTMAGLNPAPSPTKREFDSKWEETYCAELVLRKHAGLIENYFYHPFSMWLPGKVRYSPDFLIEYPLGLERRLEIVEVKGWSRNLRDGMTRLRIAAGVFPCFAWKLVRKKKGGGWDESEIKQGWI